MGGLLYGLTVRLSDRSAVSTCTSHNYISQFWSGASGMQGQSAVHEGGIETMVWHQDTQGSCGVMAAHHGPPFLHEGPDQIVVSVTLAYHGGQQGAFPVPLITDCVLDPGTLDLTHVLNHAC